MAAANADGSPFMAVELSATATQRAADKQTLRSEGILVHDTWPRKSVRGRAVGDSAAPGRPFVRAEAVPPIEADPRPRAIGAESASSTLISPGASAAARRRSQPSRFWEAILDRSFASGPSPSIHGTLILCSSRVAIALLSFAGPVLPTSRTIALDWSACRRGRASEVPISGS
jgi:hypothetical protein